MTPERPPLSNSVFTAPEDLDVSQVNSIHAFRGTVPIGPLEGAGFVVVAWKPTSEELKTLNGGGLVFLSCLGSLPPHFLTTDFKVAAYGTVADGGPVK